MSRFETEVLIQDGNVEGLGRVNATWVDRAMTHTSAHRRVILGIPATRTCVPGIALLLLDLGLVLVLAALAIRAAT